MANELKTFIDRKDTSRIQLLDKIIAELSPFLSPFALDILITHMNLISGSKYDVNPSVTDCVELIKELIGIEVYTDAKMQWTLANQKAVTPFGTKKYRDKKTHILYDGLDPEDIESDFEIIYV